MYTIHNEKDTRPWIEFFFKDKKKIAYFICGKPYDYRSGFGEETIRDPRYMLNLLSNNCT